MRYPFKAIVIVAVAGSSCATAVHAQEAEDRGTDAVLQEVTVTAQFRRQNLQDTPISITALSGEMLEARSQTTLAEVAGQTPNLLLMPPTGSYGPSLAIFIRGVGQNDFDPAFEPGVGIYIDDVYHPSLLGTDLDLLDLDRIEILRGPQGTLEGKNSLGGAIKLFSKLPDGAGGSYADATYGSRNREDLRASIDFKLTDTLFARISGVAKKQDGYVDQVDYGCANPGQGFSSSHPFGNCAFAKLGGVGDQAARGILRWVPTDRLDVVLSGDYTHADHTVAPDILIGTSAAKAGNPLNVGGTMGSQFIAGPFATYASFAGQQMTTPFKGGGPYASLVLPELDPTIASNRSIYDGWGISVNANYKIAEQLSLRSITAYRGFDTSFGVDSDGTPLSIATGVNVLHNHSFSQELRLSGALGSQVDWTVGAYYFDERSIYASVQDQRNSILPLVVESNDPIDSDSKAGFVNVGWKPLEALTVNLGGRYTEESKDYTFIRVDKNTGLPDTTPYGPAFLVAALNGAQSHYEGNKTDYRAAVDYRWTPELLTYASVSTGFKGGGVNPRPFDDLQARPFGPETMTAYEIGAKTDLLSHTLRVNLSAFFNQYRDIVSSLSSCPQFSRPGTVACSVLVNGGDGQFRGVELETTYAPVRGLSFDGSFSYLGFKYTSIDPAVGGPAHPLGPQLDTPATTPKYHASFGGQYEIALGGAGSLTPRVDATYAAKQYYARDPFTYQLEYIDSRTLANARLTWRNVASDLEAAVEVTNLTNKYYFNSIQDFRNNYGSKIGDVGRPREWAVTVKKRF